MRRTSSAVSTRRARSARCTRPLTAITPGPTRRSRRSRRNGSTRCAWSTTSGTTIYGEVVPATQRAVAGILGLPDPETLVFAANTHQFVVQILSSLDGFGSRPVRILTTDAEFHSAARQFKRLEEEGMATVERIAVQPFDTYLDRLCARLAEGRDDLRLPVARPFRLGVRHAGLAAGGGSSARWRAGDDRRLPLVHGAPRRPRPDRRPGLLHRRRLQVRDGGGGVLLPPRARPAGSTDR